MDQMFEETIFYNPLSHPSSGSIGGNVIYTLKSQISMRILKFKVFKEI